MIGLSWFFFSSEITAQAQKSQQITFTRACVTCQEFINYIEKSKGIRFYYDPEWFKSKACISVNYVNKDTESAITEFFASHDMQVFFNEGEVFISNSISIETGFTAEFTDAIARSLKDSKEKDLSLKTDEEDNKRMSNPETEIIRFGIPTIKLKDTKFHLSGTITETGNNQPVIGATIQIGGTTLGAITNLNGRYDLMVPAGQYEVIYRAIGKLTATRQVSLYADGTVNLTLNEEPFKLEEVKIIAKKNDRVNTMVGAENLDIDMMKKSIMSFGEADVIKGLLTMPGVQTTNEVSTGFNVRGGSTDQNLILIDNAPVMNATHFFGFFSAFNADMIERATLYKSGIPASLGGRISSIFDISSKFGNKQKFSLNGGLSPFTGRLSAEGPIIKDKLSFIVGARSTYSDWVLRKIRDPRISQSAASFYDILGNLHYNISKKQQLKLSFYMSNDYFKFAEISSNDYSNLVYSLNYEAKLNDRLIFNTSLSSSTYSFGMIDETVPSYSKKSTYNINQNGINLSLAYNLNDWVNLKYGFNGILYNTKPGKTEPFGSESLIFPKELEPEKAFEGAVFINNEQNITNWLSVLYGVRYSGIGNIGPKTIFDYSPGASKSINTLTDTLFYAQNALIKLYNGLEPRILLRIKTSSNSSVKLSYNKTRQYINLIFNTISAAPTDIWKLSDTHFKPQEGEQIAVGFYHDFVNRYRDNFSVSLEAYYKEVNNMLDYKVGAELFTNEHFETEIINGINKSYGIELQLVKETGSLNGWINYSFSRSLNKFDNLYPEETINYGDFFPANYDKPHNLKAVINYDFFRRLRFSTNIYYSNGRPVTYPQTAFVFSGSKKVQFSERNLYRLPDHFRIDFSATFEGDYRIKKIMQGSLTFSVINLTGRRNPYSVLFQYDRFRRLKSYYLSIFGVPVPTLTYNFKF